MKFVILAIVLAALPVATCAEENQSLDAERDAHAGHSEEADHHWSAPPDAANRRNPVSASKASIRRGQALYRIHCAGCHGADGAGGGTASENRRPAPPNLREMSSHHSAGDLAWKIANGRGPMPAWLGTLTQKQIWDLVNYLKQLGK